MTVGEFRRNMHSVSASQGIRMRRIGCMVNAADMHGHTGETATLDFGQKPIERTGYGRAPQLLGCGLIRKKGLTSVVRREMY